MYKNPKENQYYEEIKLSLMSNLQNGLQQRAEQRQSVTPGYVESFSL
jgi:hypothetical protein